MAIKDYLFLDEAGVQALSNYLLTKVNTRINDRIIKDPTGEDIALIDDSHVISAAAIMNLLGIGNSGDEESIGSQLSDLNEKLQALTSQVNSFTHLKIQTYIGDIEDIVDPKQDVFYFQKDAPVMDHDSEGFLLDMDGHRITATGSDDQPYYAFIDPDTQEVVKHNGSNIVQEDGKNVVLDGEDPIFDQVKIIEDTTWTIYAYVNAKSTPDGEEELQWINFGDFDIELQNYWSKSDEDVAELRDRLSVPNVNPIEDDAIRTAVESAFEASAPEFTKRETTVTINFKFQDKTVGTQEVTATIGAQKEVLYSEMTVPMGYEVADKEGTSITFTAIRDNTEVDVNVQEKTELETPTLTLSADPMTVTGPGSTTLTLTGLPEGGAATVTCDDPSVVPAPGEPNTWTAQLSIAKTYTFTAEYAGDSSHNPASTTVQVTMEKGTPSLTLEANPTTLTGPGEVTLTASGVPDGSSATITCDDETIIPTPGAANTWTAQLNDEKTYTFTVSTTETDAWNASSAQAQVTLDQMAVIANP